MMTAPWPLRYPSGQKRSKVHSLCSLWLICHLDFRPEEHLDKNLNTTIKETEYRERRLEDCDTRSFKTFGSVDIFQCCSENFCIWGTPLVEARFGYT